MPDHPSSTGAGGQSPATLESGLGSGFDDSVTGLPGIQALLQGTLADPFSVLGPHRINGKLVVRTFFPGADSVAVVTEAGACGTTEILPGVFIAVLDRTADAGPGDYLLRIQWPDAVQEIEDPYAFGLLLGDLDLHLLREGNHFRMGTCMGAQPATVSGVHGIRFAVWAPNARRVSVVGDFNNWDGRRNPMRLRISAGVWEIFIPRLQPGARYKYELVGSHGLLPLKADPVANQSECPPATASVVAEIHHFQWHDEDWLASRPARHRSDAPLSIYELHAGSWRLDDGRPNWPGLAAQLIPYVKALGFTHIELLPVTGHPFHGSWGYQTLSLFAPHAPLGTPAEFAAFIDSCHQAELGVLLDWVPGHFPTDVHGLARFDGSALYEHEDPREGFHQDWNTLIYNMGRHEVSGFLLASALHWLEHYHLDGLRVDAVASMLYRDYSRAPGEWIPNQYGGRENLEAIAFLRRLNQVVKERVPGALVIAEESTAWPGVTAPVEEGGLGFDYKWNMGWMHDSLVYMQTDPLYRNWEHGKLTFGLLYAFSERFVLPISHDEVVHGKRSLLGKMPGDRWQRFANLRAYLSFMWTHPGKKLLFMGCELAQPDEWNHDVGLPWGVLEDPAHRGVQRLVTDLNALYRRFPALHRRDSDPSGFAWVIGDDNRNSVYGWFRFAEGHAPLLVVANFTPQVLSNYRIGVPVAGLWIEAFNSDSELYGGSNAGNGGRVVAVQAGSHGHRYSVDLVIPPLAVIVLIAEQPGG